MFKKSKKWELRIQKHANIEDIKMVRNVNNKKSEKPLSPNGLSQVGGGAEPQKNQ